MNFFVEVGRYRRERRACIRLRPKPSELSTLNPWASVRQILAAIRADSPCEAW